MNEPTGMSALAKVREAAQNSRFDEAETLLSAILVETPTDAEAHTLSFAIAMQRQDFTVARKRAEAALAFLPDNPTFLSNLGAALMQSGDHETAMGHLDAAIEASPDHFTARRNRGMLYAALGRYTDAANDLKVAVQTEPNRGDAQMAYADALIESRQFETAIAVIREAARLKIGRPIERTYLWGRLMFRMGRFEDARQAFSTVLSADPDQMKYYQACAAANYHSGAVFDAKTDYPRRDRKVSKRHAQHGYSGIAGTRPRSPRRRFLHHYRPPSRRLFTGQFPQLLPGRPYHVHPYPGRQHREPRRCAGHV
jgi:Flp pilus assembly protein TadD